MPSCPGSTRCNLATGALLSSLVIAFGCMVVQRCWLGSGVREGREKGLEGCPWDGHGRQSAEKPGNQRAGDGELHPKWRTRDQVLQPCRLLGSSTALDGSRKDFGWEAVLGLVGTCHQVALNRRDPALQEEVDL